MLNPRGGIDRYWTVSIISLLCISGTSFPFHLALVDQSSYSQRSCWGIGCLHHNFREGWYLTVYHCGSAFDMRRSVVVTSTSTSSTVDYASFRQSVLPGLRGWYFASPSILRNCKELHDALNLRFYECHSRIISSDGP